MAVLADNDVVMHGNSERPRDVSGDARQLACFAALTAPPPAAGGPSSDSLYDQQAKDLFEILKDQLRALPVIARSCSTPASWETALHRAGRRCGGRIFVPDFPRYRQAKRMSFN